MQSCRGWSARDRFWEKDFFVPVICKRTRLGNPPRVGTGFKTKAAHESQSSEQEWLLQVGWFIAWFPDMEGDCQGTREDEQYRSTLEDCKIMRQIRKNWYGDRNKTATGNVHA